MAKAKRSNEISKDYRMLKVISEQLRKHEHILHDITAKAVAKKSKSDLEYGLLENLDIVADHMSKARKEIDKARSKLKRI